VVTVGAEHPTGSLQSHGVVDQLAHEQGFLQVVVVSPARPIFEGRAKHLSIMARSDSRGNGSLGIWPRHCDLVAALGVGPMNITLADGSVKKFAISGGFLKLGGSQVTVLVDKAATADEVDRAATETALTATKQALQHPKSDEEFEQLQADRTWQQTQLAL